MAEHLHGREAAGSTSQPPRGLTAEAPGDETCPTCLGLLAEAAPESCGHSYCCGELEPLVSLVLTKKTHPKCICLAGIGKLALLMDFHCHSSASNNATVN